MWDEIFGLRNTFSKAWIISGDFNMFIQRIYNSKVLTGQYRIIFQSCWQTNHLTEGQDLVSSLMHGSKRKTVGD
ncbi:hypothetical protein EPI10_030246 [Gossypium australe]|uniref:Uncharacterized protein n=1 Tax=Gossypium australe TaxID=47621 RepID=A0A5B6WY03_9ROSI|nr:hypothetical protein EPI10_030246 [Gossypium australe]